MTTPERLRRRQQREGIGLIVLGILVGLSSLYFHGQDVKQRDCIANNFGELTSSLSLRGQISAREARATRLESRATRLESRANNAFYKAAFAATTKADVFGAYGTYRVALHEVNTLRHKVDTRRARIARDRAEHPIPDFPAGTCA